MRYKGQNMNYEELDETELNNAIAEVLGMKLVKLDKPEVMDWFEPTIGKQVHIENWYYYDLQGENISGTWDTKDNAWEHATTPDYAEDTNEALKLTVDGFKLHVFQGNDHLSDKWVASYISPGAITIGRGWGESPSLAICRARLALVRFKPNNE